MMRLVMRAWNSHLLGTLGGIDYYQCHWCSVLLPSSVALHNPKCTIISYTVSTFYLVCSGVLNEPATLNIEGIAQM